LIAHARYRAQRHDGEQEEQRMTIPGKAWLVGAGPGDPELITLRGVHAIERADVVLYDRLVAQELLAFARPNAELVDVGKRRGDHPVPQEEINRLLVGHVRNGKNVVRLKSGDPFVFGRGGEEAEALAAAGLVFEVIPGITAAVAAGASCIIPLTKRGVSSCVTLVTGHEDPQEDTSNVDWAALARVGGTVVIYMGMAHLEKTVATLIASGFAPDTPAAVVREATMPGQAIVAAPLEKLPAAAAERGLEPPAVVIIGNVVPNVHRTE
jgi:uroporphyrin-III C-methyltransferase